MAKRHRSRSRTRRSSDQAHRAPVARVERESAPAPRSSAHRPATRFSRTGYSRAVGAPSAALERAAVLEGGFIVKDFRRLSIVVAIVLVLLIAAGAVESFALK